VGVSIMLATSPTAAVAELSSRLDVALVFSPTVGADFAQDEAAAVIDEGPARLSVGNGFA
jgi:hypothetical protein